MPSIMYNVPLFRHCSCISALHKNTILAGNDCRMEKCQLSKLHPLQICIGIVISKFVAHVIKCVCVANV